MSKKFSRLVAALVAMPLCFMLLNAQEDGNAEGAEQAVEANPWLPEIFQEGRMISIGNFNIENPTALSSSPLLKGSNRPNMWRFFMNGVSDAKGYPVPWQALGIDATALDADAIIDMAHKKSNLPSIMLKGGAEIVFEKPAVAPEDLFKMRGQMLRFFVWIKAEEVGKGTDIWNGSPSVKLTLVDGGGNVVTSAKSLFKTRGTYPWFCYHVDVSVPFNYTIPVKQEAVAEEAPAEGEEAAAEENADVAQDADAAFAAMLFNLNDEEEETASKEAGLYVTISNPASGNAWFSTLSWQRINQRDSMLNSFGREFRLDPVTGSYAPNPDYDELPMHFFFGIAKNNKWNFLNGTRVLPDMTRKANLEKYLATVDKDWMAMQYVLPNFVTIFNNATILKSVEGFEDGWSETLAAAIEKLQDSRTGMWCANGVLNLFITEQIISNCFGAKPPVRKDWEPQPEDWKGLKGMELHYADALISTIVSSMKPAKKGAAWNDCAFQDILKDTPEGQAACDITATAAAARILRYAIAYAAPENIAQAEEALKNAWTYVTEYMVLPNGLWKTSSLDSSITSPGFMFRFLDATDWMEFRSGEDLLPTSVQTRLSNNGQLTVTWNSEAPYVALRVFVAPTDVPSDKLNESHLFAVLQPRTTSITRMDPVIGLRFLAASAKKTWGNTPRTDGANYLAVKLARTPSKLRLFDKTQNVKFNIPAGKRKLAVHLAAVTAYGEMSPVLTLPEKILPTGADAEE